MSLRSRLESWVIAKAVTEGFKRLEAEHLGERLDAALDAKFGPDASEQHQQELVKWLKSIIQELEADATPKRLPSA